MALSIVGAGFGRTGTLSLKSALETLGFGPCYHMLVVAQHPGHVERWNAAADGAVDGWDEIFSGYQSAVDWPACRYWRELAAAYPESRVLLSVRDPDSWYDSVHQTLYQFMTREVSETDPPALVSQLAMARRIVLEQTFDGRFDDRRHAIGVFERHSEEVRRTIPAERLLVFEAKQGWEPLCEFLGVPVPDQPYPRTNSREELMARHAAAASESS